MNRSLGAVCVIAVIGICVSKVEAQELAPTARLTSDVAEVTIGGTRVPLSVLLEFAERRAPSLSIAVAEVRLAEADEGAALPVLAENATLQAGIGSRILSGGGRDLNGQVQLLQPIEVGGQRGLRRDVAAASRDTLERNLDLVRWQVHQEIHAGYQRALAAQQRAKIARQLEAFTSELVEVAERRVGVGDAASLILRLTEAAAVQARQRAVAALQEYRDACLYMAEISGWAVSSPPEPVGELTAPRRPPTLRELTELAAANNPNLLFRRAQVVEATARAALANRDAIPDPQFGAQYSYEGDPSGGPPEHIIMGMIQIPITSFDRNLQRRMGAAAERDVAEARREVVSRTLEVRLERLRSDVDSAAIRVESYRADVVPRFEENLAMLKRAFELGEIDLLRVSIAMERLLTVQDEALAAHVHYFAAVAALEAQIGAEIWEEDRNSP